MNLRVSVLEGWKACAWIVVGTTLGYLALGGLSRSLGGVPLAGVRSFGALLAAAGAAVAVSLGRRIGDWRRRPWSASLGVTGREERRREYALWLVELRWVAVAAVASSILVAVPIFAWIPSEILSRVLSWWVLLVAGNLAFRSWALRGRGHAEQLLWQVILDLVVLTGLLNASGGLENPLFILYLFPVILAGILLPRRLALGATLVAILLFLFLAVGEWRGWLPHVTNAAFPHARAEAAGLAHEHATSRERAASHRGETPAPTEHASLEAPFVLTRIAPFATVVALVALLTTMVMERLRRADLELAMNAEEALLEKQRLDSVVEASGLGLMRIAPDGRLLWISPRVRAWTGWDEAAADAFCPLLGSEAGCGRCWAILSAETGRIEEGERKEIDADGRARVFRHVASPVLSSTGEVVQIVEVVEEITRRKALENEAHHAAKLAAVGRMAAGVAHEVGNPLSSIRARLSLLRRKAGDAGYIEESVAAMQGQIDRIARIVHGISRFGRIPREGWTTWEVNDLVQEVVELVHLDRRARSGRLGARLPEVSPTIRGARDQISQVLLNLVLNAFEAQPEGGRVDLSVEEGEGWVEIAVRDEGPGIEEKHRLRLFEPFFTTKSEGSGLGLSISYSLVHAHGGELYLDEGAGTGSRFVLRLPSRMAAEGTKPIAGEVPS